MSGVDDVQLYRFTRMYQGCCKQFYNGLIGNVVCIDVFHGSEYVGKVLSLGFIKCYGSSPGSRTCEWWHGAAQVVAPIRVASSLGMIQDVTMIPIGYHVRATMLHDLVDFVNKILAAISNNGMGSVVMLYGVTRREPGTTGNEEVYEYTGVKLALSDGRTEFTIALAPPDVTIANAIPETEDAITQNAVWHSIILPTYIDPLNPMREYIVRVTVYSELVDVSECPGQPGDPVPPQPIDKHGIRIDSLLLTIRGPTTDLEVMQPCQGNEYTALAYKTKLRLATIDMTIRHPLPV